MTVSANGQSATFFESGFVSFLCLTNDPFFGEPEVILAGPATSLTFGFDFAEAVGGSDSFSAIMFDSDLGLFGGELERFETTTTQSGLVSFDLAS